MRPITAAAGECNLNFGAAILCDRTSFPPLHIVKYVNMRSRALTRARERANATGIESPSTKGAQVFTQPARRSNVPFISAFRTGGREWSRFHGSPSSSQKWRRRDEVRRNRRSSVQAGAIKYDRQRIANAMCRATDLCLVVVAILDAIKSDISGGAVYRDSAKSAPRRPVAPIKTGP